METTTISSKFQIVIPRRIREQFQMQPGQKVAFIPYKRSLRLVVVPEVESAYGYLQGIDPQVEREVKGQ